MDNGFKRLKYACYTTNISMSVVGNLPPLLFITFRSLYGVSYSLLGLLVLINFTTQLIVDLAFSFYAHKFNVQKAVKLTPVLTAVGLLIYAVYPFLFPHSVYLGLVLGTIVFSSSAGLAEVLISPVIAAIPAENPDREMSRLHSIYAWGVVLVVIISTVFLLVFKADNWQWLVLCFLTVPAVAAMLFAKCTIPHMAVGERASGTLKLLCNKRLLICIFCIFLGGASECIMAQWSSGYLEQAMQIPKLWGDIFGVALFAAMLGTGRTLYSKYGKKIDFVLLIGAVGAAICYLIAVLSNIPLVGLLACALTGLCVSMLWPGSLIIAQDRFPKGGVAVFALMAAGGDLGASVGPQIVGVVTDAAMESAAIGGLAISLGLTAEQLAMKIGMSVAIVFPLTAIALYAIVWKTNRDKKQAANIAA